VLLLLLEDRGDELLDEVLQGPRPAGTSAPHPAPARSLSTIGKHEKLSIVC